jgi:periplasmic protein TonB
MPGRTDILDQQESLRAPFVQSVMLHAAVFGLAIISTISFRGRVDTWGGQTHAGEAVPITPVSKIPLPSHSGRVNPVANDTVSQAQQAPKPEPKKQVKAPEEKAIPLKSRQVKKQPRQQAQQRYRSEPLRPDQATSSEAPALRSPMFQKPGGGAVGLGQNNTLGNRFGAYADLIAQRVTEKWQTGGLAGQSAPVVIVTFEILRDGTVRNAKVAQRSGNTTLDYSALRAVMDAGPFPPLPSGYDRTEANIELQFQLQR